MNGSELNRTDTHLHARIFRIGERWYADVGDDEDPQPDNPIWSGIYPSQEAALCAACQLLATLSRNSATPAGSPG